MPYIQNLDLHFTTIDGELASCRLNRLHTNGRFVRRDDGLLVLRPTKTWLPNHQYFGYAIEQEEKLIAGTVRDKVMSSRLLEYISTHYGSCNTNCSTFAQYMTTGELKPCDTNDFFMVFEKNMTTYAGQKIQVGDVIFVLYAGKIFNSRNMPADLRKMYKIRKREVLMGRKTILDIRHKDRRTYCPEEIRDMCGLGIFKDYHFMVCVDVKAGTPIFAHQYGRDLMDESCCPGVIFTKGPRDPYVDPNNPPFLTLINRAKNN